MPARLALRKSLGINVEAVPAGALLTLGRYALPGRQTFIEGVAGGSIRR